MPSRYNKRNGRAMGLLSVAAGNRRRMESLEPERRYPLLPDTHYKTILEIDHVWGRTTQYNVISTNTQRRQQFFIDDFRLPMSTWTEFFDMRRELLSASCLGAED